MSSAIRHDTRNFILDPQRGGFREFRALIAGGILGGDNDFYTLNASWQKYWPSWKSSIFAGRVMLGYADSYGRSEEVPVENRFFTGGGNSVRGYDENSIGPKELVEDAVTGQSELTVVGGRVFMLTNIEMRFPLPWLSRWNFSGAIFADGGNVWEDPQSVKFSNFQLFKNQDDVTLEDYRYGVGLGIRYNTPLHFSLGQIF
jgi:outer membrane protein insertion porin family